jgi:hypothetical protein
VILVDTSVWVDHLRAGDKARLAATTADPPYNKNDRRDIITSALKEIEMKVFNSRNINSLLGMSIIILMALYAVTSLIGVFIPGLNDRLISLTVGLPYWSTIIGLFVSFIISSFYALDTKMGNISQRTMPHLEIFQNTRDYQVRMGQLNSIATLILGTNFSYPPDQKKEGPLVNYYSDLHQLIRRADSTLESFRVIANVCDEQKATWVINRAISFEGCSRFSMAITYIPHAQPLQCIHIIVPESEKYIFFSLLYLSTSICDHS